MRKRCPWGWPTRVKTCRAEDGGSMFLSNVSIYLQIHMALHPRRPTSTSSLRWDLRYHEVLFILNCLKGLKVYRTYYVWVIWSRTFCSMRLKKLVVPEILGRTEPEVGTSELQYLNTFSSVPSSCRNVWTSITECSELEKILGLTCDFLTSSAERT
jgi:hypothetical protein